MREEHFAILREMAAHKRGEGHFPAGDAGDRTSVEAFQRTVRLVRELGAAGYVEIQVQEKTTAFGVGLVVVISAVLTEDGRAVLEEHE